MPVLCNVVFGQTICFVFHHVNLNLTQVYLLQSLSVNGEVIFYDGAELHFSEGGDSGSGTSNSCKGD